MKILDGIWKILGGATNELSVIKAELDARREELRQLERAPVSPAEVEARLRRVVERAAAAIDVEGFIPLIFRDGRQSANWSPPFGFGLMALLDPEALVAGIGSRLEAVANARSPDRPAADEHARRVATTRAEISRLEGARRQIVDELDRSGAAIGRAEVEAARQAEARNRAAIVAVEAARQAEADRRAAFAVIGGPAAAV